LGWEFPIRVTARFKDRRAHIDSLIAAALYAADPAVAVRRNLRRVGNSLYVGPKQFDLHSGRIYLVGVGKASVAMGAAAGQVLGDLSSQGILVTKAESVSDGTTTTWAGASKLTIYFAGHPISDQRSVDAAAAIELLLANTATEDLVLFLISGGASALLTRPLIPLPDWRALNEILLNSGCTIGELNTVRRRLDRVKGGGLSRLAAPAAQASLILSDVVGNRLEAIGSGPTVSNPDDVPAARKVLARYSAAGKLGTEAWGRIEFLLNAAEEEESVEAQPAAEEPAFNLIIGDVAQAAEAAATAAHELGFSARVLTTHLEGEAREVGKVVAALSRDAPANSCLILGGETTVTVRGDGLGGRNQELALSAALAIDGSVGQVIASFATDGEDGPTEAAGAIVSGETVQIARKMGLSARDCLERNDSYHFFREAGGLLETGQTGTNVNDLIFALHYEG
jgi:hydroxypyruvate reductase